jgi:hypothetical protein
MEKVQNPSNSVCYNAIIREVFSAGLLIRQEAWKL